MSNDVTATQPNDAALINLMGNSDDDFVDMRKRDFILPRAQLTQPLSPDVVEGRCPAGAIRDSSTKQVIVAPKQEGMFIIPLMFWLEWIEWNRDRDASKDKMIIERSVDPTSKLARRAEAWETYVNDQGKEKAVVTEYYNFVCAIINAKYNDYDSVYLTGFARSSHKIGKMWLNSMYKRRIEINGEYVRPRMWATRWALSTRLETKDSYKFFIPVIGEGTENPRTDWAKLKDIADSFTARRAEIMDRNSNVQEASDEDAAAADGAPKAAATFSSEV